MIRRHLFLFLAAAALLLGILLALLWTGRAPLPGAAPPSAESAPVRQLRFGHNTPEDSALHAAAARFAQQVAERSGGRLRVAVHPAQQLGNDHQMVEMARAGELDILLTPTAKMSVPLPAMQYADLPFFFPARDDLYAMLDGEPGRMLLDKLHSIDLVGVTFWENGFKHFTANRPLTRPQDFADLKIRTMKSRILMEQFRSFGATPIPIDFHATRAALADGVVDGQENPLVAIYSMGFHQVQSDLTLSSHGYLGYVLSISAKVFETLPQDLRQILLETGRELTTWERAETHRREQDLLQRIRDTGVTVHTLDEAARQAFAARTAHIPGLFEAVIGPDLLSKTQELLFERYGEKDAIVIGLDADLSADTRAASLAIKRGATLAIEQLNAAGGVLDGRPLRLLARDHRGQPTKGADNIHWFARQPRVVAILGGPHSPVAIAELEPVHAHGIPFIATWSAAAEVVENGHRPNYVFRVSANDRFAAPFIVEHLPESVERPALVVENTLWGRSNQQRMQRHIQSQGGAFVYTERVNRDQQLDALLQRLQENRADAVVLVTSPQEGERLLRALAEMPAPPQVVAHWGVAGTDLWRRNQAALRQLDFSFFQTFTFAHAANPQALALDERYRTRYRIAPNQPIVAPVGVAQAYDAVHLLARAIQRAGSAERSAVRDALERIPRHTGAIRVYAPPFTPERHDALSLEDYHIARFDHRGRIVPSRHGEPPAP